jgi:hypothetical protein
VTSPGHLILTLTLTARLAAPIPTPLVALTSNLQTPLGKRVKVARQRLLVHPASVDLGGYPARANSTWSILTS